MSYIFFDTETTGFAKGGIQPRIIQMAWIVAAEDGSPLTERSCLIKPNGWVVPQEKFWIDNGHSTERCDKHGQEMHNVLGYFFSDSVEFNCHTLIAHNLAYDAPVLASEMNHTGVTSNGRKLNKICTMKSAEHLFGKWPKLIQLHEYLFNKGFDGAHDAMSDVRATAYCFFELKKRGISFKS